MRTLLYKCLPEQYAASFLERGEVLFRSLSYFRQVEDAARGDLAEGVEVQAPGEPSTLVNLDTGVSITGYFPVLSSINQDRVFAFCCSREFSAARFDEFGCDRCVVIEDPDTFLQRYATAVRERFTADSIGLLHGPVDYYAASQLRRLSDKDPRSIPFIKDERFYPQTECIGLALFSANAEPVPAPSMTAVISLRRDPCTQATHAERHDHHAP